MSTTIDELKSSEVITTDYDYGSLKEVSWFTRLLWYSAGADAQLLMRCPMSDRVKYQGLGGIVLSVGMLAFFSGSYAFYTVFSPKNTSVLGESSIDWITVALSVFFGLFWGLIIFNLDRFIVSSTGKGDGTDKITMTEFVNSLPRLFMAIVIGVCLSAPLEIKILESEIKAELEIEQREYLQKLNDSSDQLIAEQRIELRDKIDGLQERLDESDQLIETRRQEVLQQRRQLELEAEGQTGSGTAGRGPAWRDKKDNLDRMEAELDRYKETLNQRNQPLRDEIDQRKAELENLNQQLADKRESNKQSAQHLDGLLKRIQISHEIGGLVPIAIMMLLLFIEAGPIFFKLMLTKGAYDYLEENQKRLARAAAGIEVKGENQDDEEIFHAVDNLLNVEKNRIHTEQQLTETVHQAYRDLKSKDIHQNPENYIEK